MGDTLHTHIINIGFESLPYARLGAAIAEMGKSGTEKVNQCLPFFQQQKKFLQRESAKMFLKICKDANATNFFGDKLKIKSINQLFDGKCWQRDWRIPELLGRFKQMEPVRFVNKLYTPISTNIFYYILYTYNIFYRILANEQVLKKLMN